MCKGNLVPAVGLRKTLARVDRVLAFLQASVVVLAALVPLLRGHRHLQDA